MSAISLLRNIGKIEAISSLVLLFIAMPLKYAHGMPEPVKIVGWIHGLLFIFFCLALGHAKLKSNLSVGLSALAFLAALFPFGPFLIDSKLKRLEAAAPSSHEN